MLRKFLLSFNTSFAVKRNNAIRISEGYMHAKKIGIVLTFKVDQHKRYIDDLMSKIKQDGKELTILTYMPVAGKEEEFSYPNFTDHDLEFTGKFNNETLAFFVKMPFDYLLNLDVDLNPAIANVLANSKAKCRVGNYNENKHEFYELMIDAKESSYEDFLVQMYHYMKSVRNG